MMASLFPKPPENIPSLEYLDELTPDELLEIVRYEIRRRLPSLDLIQSCIAAGVDLPRVLAMIHYAAHKGHVEVVNLLLKKGASVNARNLLGKTAWEVAHSRVKEQCPELQP